MGELVGQTVPSFSVRVRACACVCLASEGMLERLADRVLLSAANREL